MKKYLLLLLTAFLLTACNEEETEPVTETPTEETESVETESVESETIEVTMETEVDTTDNKATVTGNTNLPDGGELMTTVEGNDFKAQSKNIIESGSFASDTFSNKGEGLAPGTYTVTVSLSIPTTQPDEFVEQAGEEYENLTGDLMEDATVGKTMSYETEFTIE